MRENPIAPAWDKQAARDGVDAFKTMRDEYQQQPVNALCVHLVHQT